ncbi:MAG: alanine/glycine:cation symporter family protein [Pseudomonadota bacterium]
MGLIEDLFGLIGSLTWGWSLIPLLVIFGLFLSLATNFVQFRYFKRMFRVLTGKDEHDNPNALSPREALFLSVGGRVGGGNIAGVAVAITLGGPGAVFWMWAIALVGMATSLVECTLAQTFKRREEDGGFRGGPAAMILHGLGSDFRWLAIVYAVSLIAAFGLGFNAFQGNTVAGAAQDSLGLDRTYTAVIFAAIAGWIVFGGIHRIAKAADIIVPVMAFLYIALALLVILVNILSVPGVLWNIVSSAFGFNEAVAGGMGAALAQGLRRGLFSNEAGLGSAPNVAATADVRHPVSQGITQSLSVFIDTMIICTCTALMILLSDVYQVGADVDGVVLTQNALASHLGGWTEYFLTLAVLLFAFSSVIYNYYLGENALTVFTENPMYFIAFKIIVIAVVFLGAIAPGATSVFFFSDPMMGILAIVNLLALMMLFPTVRRVLRDFDDQRKAGIERPEFDSGKFADLDIDKTAWVPKE